MTRTLIRLLTATVVALATGVATAAPAAAQPPIGTVQGDFDDDGVIDQASLVRSPAGGWELLVELATGRMSAALPADDRIPEVGLRVTDLDANMAAEVLTPVSVGANTTTYQVFNYMPDRGLAPLTRPDGDPFELHEGGGVAAVSGYACPLDDGLWVLAVVGATMKDGGTPGGEPRYEGYRSIYAVADGVVTPIDETRISDASGTDPVLVTDPATCAPRT
jgi:hypothetical protein